VTNTINSDNKFTLAWSITDTSGDVTDLDFGEGGIDVGTGGANQLSDSSGMKQEYLASTGPNGYIFELNADGTMLWSYKLDPTGTAWAGSSSISASLSSNLQLLTFTVGGQSVTLTLGYSIPGSTARFRILGTGPSGQYIIRVDGSANGATDGMFAANAGGEGEAAPVNTQYAGAADAVFTEKSWA
jgi:hypothetical protein